MHKMYFSFITTQFCKYLNSLNAFPDNPISTAFVPLNQTWTGSTNSPNSFPGILLASPWQPHRSPSTTIVSELNFRPVPRFTNFPLRIIWRCGRFTQTFPEYACLVIFRKFNFLKHYTYKSTKWTFIVFTS